MCIPNLEFQLVNPTTQVALFSLCQGDCLSLKTIQWNIYQGSNTTLSTMNWILFNETSRCFGKETSNFTANNQLFLDYPQISYWRFEVIYSFENESSSSALNFVINQPPENGSCSISPLNGTTMTLFNILCLNWFDQDEIKDYLLYSIEIINFLISKSLFSSRLFN